MEKTRVQVPLDSDTLDAVRDYCDATGMPLGRACAEILENTAPVLRDMAKALRTAKTAPSVAIRNVSDELERQIAAIRQQSLDLKPKATRRAKKTG